MIYRKFINNDENGYPYYHYFLGRGKKSCYNIDTKTLTREIRKGVFVSCYFNKKLCVINDVRNNEMEEKYEISPSLIGLE